MSAPRITKGRTGHSAPTPNPDYPDYPDAGARPTPAVQNWFA